MVAGAGPSPSVTGVLGSLGRDAGIELIDQVLHVRLGGWLEVVGMCTDDVKGSTVMVGCSWIVAASLGDHCEAFVTFRELGEASKQVAGYDFGLIEGACVDQIEHHVVVGFK